MPLLRAHSSRGNAVFERSSSSCARVKMAQSSYFYSTSQCLFSQQQSCSGAIKAKRRGPITDWQSVKQTCLLVAGVNPFDIERYDKMQGLCG
ncbi:MAG: hypothetical protein GY820_18605 [Gammaproteobacteria bacterium]|nr:hypothetical protein [Gammaproteobacteria bacterium]